MSNAKLQFGPDATKRLRAKWRAWQHAQRERGFPFSQAEAGARMDWTQGAVSQYLSGAMPLNLNAVFSFAALFGCDPNAIVPNVVPGVREPTPSSYVPSSGWDHDITAQSRELLAYFNMLTDLQQNKMIEIAKAQAEENKAVLTQLSNKLKTNEPS